MTRKQAREGSDDVTIFADALPLVQEATKRLLGLIDETELSEGELADLEILKNAVQEFTEAEAEKISC